MSSVVFSFNDDIGRQIDDARFTQQFYVNTRGLTNHSVNPFSRLNLVRKPVSYRNVHPVDANYTEETVMSTTCCNSVANPVVTGKRKEDAPLENSTLFWTDLQTKVHRIPRTTDRIGLDETENK